MPRTISVVGAADAPHLVTGSTARAIGAINHDVIAGAEAQQGVSLATESGVDEFTSDTLSRRQHVAVHWTDELGNHEIW